MSKTITVPFIICGDADTTSTDWLGTNEDIAQEPYFGVNVDYLEFKPAVDAKRLILKHYDDMNYGYLRITVDRTHLRSGFQQVGKNVPQSRVDMVTVDLAARNIVAN